jgi:AraC family cel operon transcriptional repressor
MAKLLLRSKDFITEDIGGSCGFFSSLIYTTTEHSHDFFEFFLITEGRVNHVVNDQKQVLRKGALVFIRPNDVHYYKKINNDDCQFFNLAFQTELAYDLFRFLGPAYEAERLLQPEMPPHVQLAAAERDTAKERIQRCFVKSAGSRALSVELKRTILDLFTTYFPAPRAETVCDMPEWLSVVCTKMQSRENFSRGLEALQELACRSHEHLCHLFQKHLGTTPVNYINGIRLEYAASLLTFTDKAIIDVNEESGFNNLSHFYHLFKKKYNVSPNHYRRMHARSMVPAI